MSYYEVVMTYPGSKRRLYHQAMLELRTDGLKKRDCILSMFVKADRITLEKHKDPRAIQHRHPKYNLAFQSFVKPLEHHVYSNLLLGYSNTRVVAKGLNPYQRASLFIEKCSHYEKPMFLCIDHARCDSTIRVEHIKAVHRLYRKVYGRSRRLYQCMQAQIHNKGRTKNGITYKVDGTNTSGDPDTGYKTVIVCLLVLMRFCEQFEKWDIIMDGDDAVVIVEAYQTIDVRPFALCGFETEVGVTAELQQVEFCQCKLIETDPPVFVRNPIRVMSRAAIALKQMAPWQFRAWMAGVGACELACNSGVPVLQEYGTQLERVSTIKIFENEYRMVPGGHKWKPVTDKARLSFERAFGIDTTTQKAMESLNFTGYSYECYFKRLQYRKFLGKSKDTRIFESYVGSVKSIWRSGACFRSLHPGTSSSDWQACWPTLAAVQQPPPNGNGATTVPPPNGHEPTTTGHERSRPREAARTRQRTGTRPRGTSAEDDADTTAAECARWRLTHVSGHRVLNSS